MKRVLVAVLIDLTLSVTACSSTTVVVNSDESQMTVGISKFIKIGDCLYYDPNTYIVYLWNGYTNANCATMPASYLAPNGLAYKYNPKSNSFYEIEE